MKGNVNWQPYEKGLAWRALHFSTPEGIRDEVSRLAQMFGRTTSAVRAAGKRFGYECADPVEALDSIMDSLGDSHAADKLRLGLEQTCTTRSQVKELVKNLHKEEQSIASILDALGEAGAPVIRPVDGVVTKLPSEHWVESHCQGNEVRKVLLGHTECPDCTAPVTLTAGRLAKAVASNKSFNARFPDKEPRQLQILWRCSACSELVKRKREQESLRKELLAKASRDALTQAARQRKAQESALAEKLEKAAAIRESIEKSLTQEANALEEVRGLVSEDPAGALIKLRQINQ